MEHGTNDKLMRDINYIVLHCTAGPQNQTVEAIKEYWSKVLGWKTPGYHHLISADGKDHNLVPIDKISNGVAGHNAKSIHISYIGGVELIQVKNKAGKVINAIGRPVDNRTDAQKQTMLALVKLYRAKFPKAKIVGHRDFSPDKNRDGIIQPSEWMKTCPSFSVAEWLKCVGIKQ